MTPQSPLELERLAGRIERLQTINALDWGNADELDLRRMLPAPRNPRSFPDPGELRELALRWRKQQDVQADVRALGRNWGWWLNQAMHLEQLATRNRTAMSRVQHDLRRGRMPRGAEGLAIVAAILGATIVTGRNGDDD
jgi:hypothetical protein